MYILHKRLTTDLAYNRFREIWNINNIKREGGAKDQLIMLLVEDILEQRWNRADIKQPANQCGFHSKCYMNI